MTQSLIQAPTPPWHKKLQLIPGENIKIIKDKIGIRDAIVLRANVATILKQHKDNYYGKDTWNRPRNHQLMYGGNGR